MPNDLPALSYDHPLVNELKGITNDVMNDLFHGGLDALVRRMDKLIEQNCEALNNPLTVLQYAGQYFHHSGFRWQRPDKGPLPYNPVHPSLLPAVRDYMTGHHYLRQQTQKAAQYFEIVCLCSRTVDDYVKCLPLSLASTVDADHLNTRGLQSVLSDQDVEAIQTRYQPYYEAVTTRLVDQLAEVA